MIQLLLLGSCVILACILCNRLSSRIGIPMLLAFILLGMVFGSEGLVRIDFADFGFAETICSIALIFIMFYGGFGTRWKTAKPAALKALVMSAFGTIFTALFTGLFCHYVLHFGLLEGLLTGAVLGSTDAASVFSVLRSKNLSLKDSTDSLLEVESGSNDPAAYMLTIILLTAMKQGVSSRLPLQILTTAATQILFGLAIGAVLAFVVRWVLLHVDFETSGFDTAFVLASAVLAYALPSVIGGNGYLSAYLMGILLGNSPLPNKKTLVNFFDGLTSLMQMLIFFILGLLSFPSRIAAVWLPAAAIAAFLTLIARPLVTAILLTPLRSSLRQQILVSWAGLRGAASIVFAIMAIQSGITLEHDLFHIVFCVVLFSIAIQGTLLPWFARRTEMLDTSGNILTTFSDYSEETDVRFIDIPVTEHHPWNGMKVRDLQLPLGTLLVFLSHPGEKNTVPHGETVLRSGDVLVLGATAYTGQEDIHLSKLTLDASHPWCSRQIKDLKLSPGNLIILIRRNGQTIIPRGDTILEPGDELVKTS